ncbi:MAG TPA: EAL domain-containing protein [Ilumatobacteraceae bacterium]|nr:EAL domain-containing protein [Ilumatobacteraceae bacterium]
MSATGAISRADGAFLEALLSNAPVGLEFVDRDYRIVRLNERLAAMNGSTVADQLGCTVAEVVPELWSQLEPLYHQALASGETVLDHEVSGRTAADPLTIHRWLTTYYPVSIDDEIIGVGVIVIDVTERTQADQTVGPQADLPGATGRAIIATDATLRRLQTSLHQLAEAQRVAHIGSVEANLVTGEIHRSEEYDRILGLEPGHEQSTDQIIAMIHPDDRPAAAQAWASAIERGVPFDRTCRIVRPDSKQRWIRLRVVPERDDDGTVIKVIGTLLDETDRIGAERVRQSAEARFEIGFQQAGIGAVIVDLAGVPIRVNAAAQSLLGRTEDELVGHVWTEYTHPDEIPLWRIVLARVAAGHDTYEDERRYVRPDGTVVWASSHVTLVRDESGEPEYFYSQLQDITERKRMEEDLLHQALHDSLTGLPNRALLTDRLLQNLSRGAQKGEHLGVICLNVDHFKQINETLGHARGDQVLRHAAEQIAAAIRPGDTVARIGGDEFVVVCDNVSVGEAERIAERILQVLSQPCLIGDQQLSLNASLGIALADHHATPESLLRDSDAAMLRAKERGRARIELFDEALRFKAERRFATAAALREALALGQFTVHYQPVVDLSTGAMVSAEALVRWQHPERGLVLPAEFIPLAEEIGLIMPIGAFALEEACRQLVQWQRIQPSMTVAVNLSVRQMLAPDIAGVVKDVLTRTGAPPESLCLELTESVFMEDVEYFGATLAGLKAVGVQLSIDDFGTGYSALSYLKQFPVDAVKVDRAFVEGLGSDAHDTALVAAIVAMAAALGLEVTAEGVETHEQLVNLEKLQCQRAQGYYLARPMPADAMNQLVVDAHRWQLD